MFSCFFVYTFISRGFKFSNLEGVELPPYEAVVVRVHGGGDEGAPPVHPSPELEHVVAAPRGEVLKPLHGVREARDLVLCVVVWFGLVWFGLVLFVFRLFGSVRFAFVLFCLVCTADVLKGKKMVTVKT